LHRLGRRLLDPAVAPDALDEDPLLREAGLGLGDREADGPAVRLDAEGAKLPAMPGRAGAAQLRLSALARFVGLAGGDRVDAEQLGAEHGQHHRRARRPEDVDDGVGDRHRIQHRLGLVGRQAKPVDGIGCQSHRGGHRLRAGVQAGRGPDIISRQLGGDDERGQGEDADTTANSACGMPSEAMPRTNCGPTP
jgi:hypothetical protein